MNSTSRVTSILKTKSLDTAVTGLPTFSLAKLNLNSDLNFELPTNLRLGHVAERVVSELIKASTNYNVLCENIQILDNKTTIGEIDFIIENNDTKQCIHLELAYKFYLFDPFHSAELINNWIGPNRNDSLKEKLEKLKQKQFPLLHHASAKSACSAIDLNNVLQALCLLASLYIPYGLKSNFSSAYEKAIKGYYLDFQTFSSLDKSEKLYGLPTKKEWGIDPSENEDWLSFSDVEKQIRVSLQEKQAPLIWQKHNDTYVSFFIVWW